MRQKDDILYADEGKKLTNGTTVYADFLRLGDWDNADNYTEITLEEYENILQEQLREEEIEYSNRNDNI